MFGIQQTIAIQSLNIRDRLGIVDLNPSTFGQQAIDERQGRGFADIIGAGFEGEPPDGKRFAPQVVAEVLANLVE